MVFYRHVRDPEISGSCIVGSGFQSTRPDRAGISVNRDFPSITGISRVLTGFLEFRRDFPGISGFPGLYRELQKIILPAFRSR